MDCLHNLLYLDDVVVSADERHQYKGLSELPGQCGANPYGLTPTGKKHASRQRRMGLLRQAHVAAVQELPPPPSRAKTMFFSNHHTPVV